MNLQKNSRTLFKGGIVVTMDANVPNLAAGDVLIEDDRIVAVGASVQADGAEVIDAAGNIVMPGLIDAHHHMWLGVMRRMMPDVDDLFAYIDVVAGKLGAHYRPLDMYLSTKLTAVASLDAGITTIIDACHSSRSPGHTDAALDALDVSGIRALHMVVNGACAAGLERSIGTLTPGKQADIIMVRTNGVAVFPITNAIGAIVQAVERSDVDTVMVAGEVRKRSGKLLDVDLVKLKADVNASREFLLGASGYRPDLFGGSAAVKVPQPSLCARPPTPIRLAGVAGQPG